MAGHFPYEYKAGAFELNFGLQPAQYRGALRVPGRAARAMKNLIGFALALFLPGAGIGAAAPDRNTIIIFENAIWRNVQDKNLDQFKKLVSANVRAVFADGIQTLPDELKAIPKRTMKSVSLADFKVTCPDSKTAIVTYVAKVLASSGDKAVSDTYNAGSVWRMANGHWQAIFHGEAKQALVK
jgi:Domain of unknown function (DUF4440)